MIWVSQFFFKYMNVLVAQGVRYVIRHKSGSSLLQNLKQFILRDC